MVSTLDNNPVHLASKAKVGFRVQGSGFRVTEAVNRSALTPPGWLRVVLNPKPLTSYRLGTYWDYGKMRWKLLYYRVEGLL